MTKLSELLTESTPLSTDYVALTRFASGAYTNKKSTLSDIFMNAPLTQIVSDQTALSKLLQVVNNSAIATNAIIIGVAGDVRNSGSTAGGTGHGIGVWGRASDNTAGNHFLIGSEGKVEGLSNNAIAYYAGVSYALWQGSGTNQSVLIGHLIQREITIAGDTGNPKTQGTSYGLWIKNIVGGALNYALYIEPQSGSSVNYGLVIGAATTGYAVWLAGDSGAASGIMLGASQDTTLYRSAAATLKTDGNFQAFGGIATVGTTGLVIYDAGFTKTLALGHNGTNAVITPSSGILTVASGLMTSKSTLTPSATISLNPVLANVFTLTPDQTCTINAASVTTGQEISIVITTSGTSSYTLTFGTGFKSTGTLATGVTTAKVFTICFVSDGTNFNEQSRTTAM